MYEYEYANSDFTLNRWPHAHAQDYHPDLFHGFTMLKLEQELLLTGVKLSLATLD